jgi:hypothetical protein
MEERERAFNEFFAWWKTAGMDRDRLTRSELAQGAAAAGWNAALAWAAQRIGETKE